MKMLGRLRKDERGISVLEMFYLMALFAMILVLVRPIFTGFIYGGSEKDGFAEYFVANQLEGLNEENEKFINVTEGCSAEANEITQEQCDSLN